MTEPQTEAGRRLVGLIRDEAILAIERQAADAALAGLAETPRLWWCGNWQTLNEKRYHGNSGPCPAGNCGQVAYVRAAVLAAIAIARKETE